MLSCRDARSSVRSGPRVADWMSRWQVAVARPATSELFSRRRRPRVAHLLSYWARNLHEPRHRRLTQSTVQPRPKAGLHRTNVLCDDRQGSPARRQPASPSRSIGPTHPPYFGAHRHAPRPDPHGRPEDQGACRRARADREAVRQGLDHEDGRGADPERPAGRVDRIARTRYRARRRRAAARPGRRNLRSGGIRARRRSACRSSRRSRRPAEPRPTSTQRMRSTRCTRASSA